MTLTQKEVKKVYLGTHQVRPDVTPLPYTPTANTLMYLPLNRDYTYTDQSGNNRTITNNSVTFGTYQGVDCANFTYSVQPHLQVTPFQITLPVTILVRAYVDNVYYLDSKIRDLGSSQRICVWYNVDGSPYGYQLYDKGQMTTRRALSQHWVLLATVLTSTGGTQYIKGNNADYSDSVSITNSTFTPEYFNIGNEYNNGASRYLDGGLSQFIMENVAWSASDISDYYDATKSTYGIS